MKRKKRESLGLGCHVTASSQKKYKIQKRIIARHFDQMLSGRGGWVTFFFFFFPRVLKNDAPERDAGNIFETIKALAIY